MNQKIFKKLPCLLWIALWSIFDSSAFAQNEKSTPKRVIDDSSIKTNDVDAVKERSPLKKETHDSLDTAFKKDADTLEQTPKIFFQLHNKAPETNEIKIHLKKPSKISWAKEDLKTSESPEENEIKVHLKKPGKLSWAKEGPKPNAIKTYLDLKSKKHSPRAPYHINRENLF